MNIGSQATIMRDGKRIMLVVTDEAFASSCFFTPEEARIAGNILVSLAGAAEVEDDEELDAAA